MHTHGRSTHISNQYSHVFLQWECNEKLHLHATEFTSSLSHRDASSRYSTAMRPRASLVTFSGYCFWKRHTQGIILGSRGCRGAEVPNINLATCSPSFNSSASLGISQRGGAYTYHYTLTGPRSTSLTIGYNRQGGGGPTDRRTQTPELWPSGIN